jgi:hypothetical protein
MIIEPYADHRGHRKNLSGQHRGNLFCIECAVRVAEPQVTEAELSASAPVVAVVAGPPAMLDLRERMILRAFMTRATSPGGMQLSRAFTATIKGFNETYGAKCRTWSQVAQCAFWLLEGK